MKGDGTLMRIQFAGDNIKGFQQYIRCFELAEPPENLAIRTRTRAGAFLNWFLYSPAGRLFGQACLIEEREKVWFVSRGKALPYGVFRDEPGAGSWSLLLICVDAGEQNSGAPWTLEITTEADGGLLFGKPPEERPAFYWMDDSGRVSRDYLLSVKRAERGWYKGDFHLHTDCSDGMMPPAQLQREAAVHALDFFAITDHNFFHTGWADDSIPVIPGLELTLDDGHINLFAPHELPEQLTMPEQLAMPEQLMTPQEPADGAYSINALIGAFRKSGALASVNHPFMEPWQVKNGELDLSLVNAIEVICDPTWKSAPQASEKAIAAFTVLWDQGIQLTGIGGSDLHNAPDRPYEGNETAPVIGLPATYLYAEALSIDALKTALLAHSAYVACGFRLELRAVRGGTSYPIGSRIPCDGNDEIAFTFALKDAGRPYTAQIVENGGKITPLSLDGNGSASFTRRWEDGYHWLRVDLRDDSGTLCGFTNPFYTGAREASKLLWRNLVELMPETNEEDPGDTF
jgi:Predicted metal-dependent phosphoesterases (PHP family)